MSGEHQRVAVLVIGDEVLKGEVPDRNTLFFIEEFDRMGVEILMAAVLPDKVSVIVKFIRTVIDDVDYVIITGGIGPTPDDVTREGVSEALGVSLVTDPTAKNILEDYYGRALEGARLKMAEVPEGSILIPNPVSAAPGFIKDKVMVFPGIPQLIEKMFPFVKTFFKQSDVRRGFIYLKAGESAYSDIMKEVMHDYRELSVGSYPTIESGYKARVVIRGTDMERIKECVTDFEKRLSERRIDVQKKMFE